MTKALAYISAKLITTVKSFIVKGPSMFHNEAGPVKLLQWLSFVKLCKLVGLSHTCLIFVSRTAVFPAGDPLASRDKRTSLFQYS